MNEDNIVMMVITTQIFVSIAIVSVSLCSLCLCVNQDRFNTEAQGHRGTEKIKQYLKTSCDDAAPAAYTSQTFRTFDNDSSLPIHTPYRESAEE